MKVGIKKGIRGDGASGFIAKNIHICIYTNLYFGRGNVKNFTIGGFE